MAAVAAVEGAAAAAVAAAAAAALEQVAVVSFVPRASVAAPVAQPVGHALAAVAVELHPPADVGVRHGCVQAAHAAALYVALGFAAAAAGVSLADEHGEAEGLQNAEPAQAPSAVDRCSQLAFP